MWIPTLGGKQFWTDRRWYFGWRVQSNSTLNLWRLLSPWDLLDTIGSQAAVMASFESRRSQLDQESLLAPTHVAILLHGLLRSTSSMNPIAKVLRDDSDIVPIAIAYASSRDAIDLHAAALIEVMENLPGSPQLSFVCHSLGNIVLRHAINDLQKNGDSKGLLSRLGRVVMLGPPNRGSSFATKLSELMLFELVTGTTGAELGPAWEQLQSRLAIPPCPFAIIAGDVTKSNWLIPNPLLPGPSDWVVSVEETHLDEASETIIVPCLHSFLMSDTKAIAATVRFLTAPL